MCFIPEYFWKLFNTSNFAYGWINCNIIKLFKDNKAIPVIFVLVSCLFIQSQGVGQ